MSGSVKWCLAVGVLLVSWGISYQATSPGGDRAEATESDATAEIAKLRAELDQNWPLAKFYLDETRSHLRWAVRVIPVRTSTPMPLGRSHRHFLIALRLITRVR